MGIRDKKTGAEREATEFSEQTGYRPSVNQRRHEPLPASRHDERRQDGVLRNEEHAGDHTQAVPRGAPGAATTVSRTIVSLGEKGKAAVTSHV